MVICSHTAPADESGTQNKADFPENTTEWIVTACKRCTDGDIIRQCTLIQVSETIKLTKSSYIKFYFSEYS